jgi:hypothetical protein
MGFKEPGWSGKPWPQFTEEVEAFIAILQSEGVRSYLEIGCRHGDTVHAVGMGLPVGSRIVACDLPGMRNGIPRRKHTDSGDYLQRAADDLIANGRKTTVVIGDSHSPDTVARVRALGPFDAILIDGDHSLDGATADWRNYGPMGRIVAFHDISGIKAVRKVFDDAARSCRRVQRISVDPTIAGIGVLWRE